jgi:hypothetical protein
MGLQEEEGRRGKETLKETKANVVFSFGYTVAKYACAINTCR